MGDIVDCLFPNDSNYSAPVFRVQLTHGTNARLKKIYRDTAHFNVKYDIFY